MFEFEHELVNMNGDRKCMQIVLLFRDDVGYIDTADPTRTLCDVIIT